MEYIWNITGRCNINCAYCWDTFKKKTDLSTEKCFSIIDQINPESCDMLLFTGGEPLVRKDFFQLVQYCRKRTIKNIKLCTNGLLVDRYIDDIKLSCINEIHISLDNLNETDEQFRKETKKVIRNIKLLAENKSENLKIVVVTVISKRNIQNFEEILKFAEVLGINVSYQLAINDEGTIENFGIESMSEQEKKLFFEQLNILRKKYKHVMDYFSTNYFYTAKKYFMTGEIPKKCLAGTGFQIIDPTGKYHDCYSCRKRGSASIEQCFTSKCLIWFRSDIRTQRIANLLMKEK